MQVQPNPATVQMQVTSEEQLLQKIRSEFSSTAGRLAAYLHATKQPRPTVLEDGRKALQYSHKAVVVSVDDNIRTNVNGTQFRRITVETEFGQLTAISYINAENGAKAWLESQGRQYEGYVEGTECVFNMNEVLQPDGTVMRVFTTSPLTPAMGVGITRQEEEKLNAETKNLAQSLFSDMQDQEAAF